MFSTKRQFLMLILAFLVFSPESRSAPVCDRVHLSPKIVERMQNLLRDLDLKAEEAAVALRKSQLEKSEQANREYEARLASIDAELANVKDLETWSAISSDAKLEVIASGRETPQIKIIAAKDNSVRTFSDFAKKSELKTAKQKEFAKKMLDFMEKNADLTAHDGDSVGARLVTYDILLTENGQIMGGAIHIVQRLNDMYSGERNESYGNFDQNGSPIKYDESMQYDH